jgi:hypothetical protein
VFGALALVAGAAGAVGALYWGWPSLAVAAAALASLLGLTVLRTIRMVASGGLRRPDDLMLAFGVALAYDLGRAYSLILPAGHRQRQKAEPQQSGTPA